MMRVLPFQYRSEEDIRAPFISESPFTVTKAGLRLVKVDTYRHQFNVFQDWHSNGGIKSRCQLD